MDTSKIALYSTPDAPIDLTPSEYILDMFKHTDEDGILYLPLWPYDNVPYNKDQFFKLYMCWDRTGAKNAVSDLEKLYADLESIAEYWDGSEDFDATCLPADLQDIWNTYVKDFDTSCMDTEHMSNENIDAIYSEAEHRVGFNYAAYDVILRAQRLCKLLALGAPVILIRNEADFLAQAMAVHNFCMRLDVIDDNT